MPSVFILSGDDVGLSFDFDERIEIGRSKEADLRLRSSSISRQHACIEPQDELWILRDLGSSNGCWMDGERVDEVFLADGDVFKLGDLELRFRAKLSGSGGPEPEVDTIVAANVTAAIDEDELSAALDVGDGGDEIALEGEWSDEPVAPPAAPLHAAPKEAAEPKTAPAAGKSAKARAQARAQALGAAAPTAASSAASTGRRRVLQYNAVPDRGGLFATDVEQHSGFMRFAIYAVCVVLFVALAYGAYLMTTTMRRQAEDSAPLEDVYDEE